jgi:hypothetical protein
MKKIKFGFYILASASILVVGCTKKASVAPEADKEFQSSVDASYATSLVTEIDDIVGYLGEGYTNLNTPYFINVGGTGSIQYSTPSASVIAISYNGTVTCADGKKRSGTITLDNSASSVPNAAKYYRDAGYVGKVILSNYVVDGWTVNNASSLTITNVNANGYNPATTPLSWKLVGNLYFSYPVGSASADSITWKGTLTKTLTNSTNSLVLAPSKLLKINWITYTTTPAIGRIVISSANITYAGTVTGVVSKTKAYTYTISDDNKLTRNFGCTPDNIFIVPTATSFSTSYSEWHPFTQGVVNYNLSSLPEPRVIDYGSGCDNSGNITIKGISYPIDFKK